MSTRPRTRVPDTQIASARRETALGLAVLALVAIIGYLSWTAVDGSPLGDGYRVRVALPAESPVVRPGDAVRIGGLRAGQVRSVTVAADGRGAVAALELTRGRVGPGARARVRLKGLAGATYVELEPGDTRRALPSGATIVAGRVAGAAQLADVVAAFDRDTRRDLARTLRATGRGLAGRGTTVNRTLAAVPELAAGSTPLLRALVPQPGALTGLVSAFDRVAAGLAPVDDGSRGASAGELSLTELGRLPGAARRVLAATGDAAPALDRTLVALPATQRQLARTLPALDPLLADVRAAAAELRPGVRALRRALPALRRTEAARGGVATLAALARRATPTLRLTLPVVRQLEGSATALSALTGPVATLSDGLVPYRRELVEAPAGFTRWGDFRYAEGQAKGHRAVRFSMVFTPPCRRSPYGAPGSGLTDRKACP